MTTTNRAFIKIYRHDQAEATPRACAAPAMRSIALAAASVEFVASGAPHGLSLGESSSDASALTGSIDVLGPPAQLALDTIEPSTASDDAGNNTPPSHPTQRIDSAARSHVAPTTSKRPLSAFLPRTTRGETAVQHIPRPSGPGLRPKRPDYIANLRPGTTVASFRWPEVCRILSRQVRAELDRAAGVVSDHARAGKALIGILGLFPGSGCTTVALSLAERLASATRKTVLVDGNFRNPRLAASLDAVPTAGWQEVLRREASLGDAIVRATDDHLDLLAVTASPADGNSACVATDETARCSGMLRDAYHVVLFDLGPYFDANSRAIALDLVRRMKIDAVLAVTGPQPADLRDLATISENLKQAGCELSGVIENRVAQVTAASPPKAPSNL